MHPKKVFKLEFQGISLREVSKHEIISGPYFLTFSPNKGKYGPEITPYLDNFSRSVYAYQMISFQTLNN